MTGNNEIIINSATMCEAVQFWLSQKIIKTPVIVKSVNKMNDGMFSVKISQVPPTKPSEDK